MKGWNYSTYSKIDPEVKSHFPFPNYRQNQLETISEIKEAIDRGYKYIILEAGTGTGKSAIAATLARMFDSTFILTVTKQLQDQYLNDFRDLGFRLVKGRGNFRCKKYGEDNIVQNCDEGRCIIEGYNCEYSIKNKYGEDITREGVCAYDYQKFLGLISDVVISNYHYMFLELNFVQDFTKRNLMIFDEAHKLEDTIMNQLKLEFKRKELKEYIGVSLSKQTVRKLNHGNHTTWIAFIEKIRKKYQAELDKIKNLKNRPELHQKIIYLKKRIKDCDFFTDQIRHDPKMWMFDYDSYWGVCEFKPIKVDKYAKNTFFRYGEVCIFMSATILDYKLFAEWLGLDENEVYAIRQKSPFQIDRNPIMAYKGFDMSYSFLNQTAPKTLDTINDILERHKDDKGIIHTVSYGCTNFLKRKIDTDRFIDHNTFNRARRLEEFKRSDRPLVLISPSMNEGVDLPGDLCRFQIIYKVPYPNLSDKQTRLRKRVDSQWYRYRTSLAMVQTLGRGMRYEDDYCMTYFIDSRLKGYIRKDRITNRFLPDSFVQAVDIRPAEIDFSRSETRHPENVEVVGVESEKDSFEDLFDRVINVKPSKNPFVLNLSASPYRNLVEDKYELISKGKGLVEDKELDEAIAFYEGILDHELFENDYHVYLKLAKVYHLTGQYQREADIITKFFKSGIYARKSKIRWFRKCLKKLSELGFYDCSKIASLEEEYSRNGSLNRNLSSDPVPIAFYIIKTRKNANRSPNPFNPESFKDLVKLNENASHDEKLKFKTDLIRIGDRLQGMKEYDRLIGFSMALIDHELFENDCYIYRKLAIANRKNHRYDDEVEMIIRFFKSGICCDDEQLKWFRKRLKTSSKYGSFDWSEMKNLELEYKRKCSLNESKIDLPVLSSYKIKKADDLEAERKHRVRHESNLEDIVSQIFDFNPANRKIDLEYADYSRTYFNLLANEITQIPGYVSDRDLLKHENEDFIIIEENQDMINEKADLINRGRELEKEEPDEAIEFYDGLKSDPLFANDYYPYRRQCILFKNRLKIPQRDWETVVETFERGIYLNRHQHVWFRNKALELIEMLDIGDSESDRVMNLILDYGKDEMEYDKLHDAPLPIAERIKKDKKSLNVLSREKFDLMQDIFYLKELGVGYIRRSEYETAIEYHVRLLENGFLYLQHYAFKQLGRICDEMNDSNEFKRIYERYI